MTHLVVELLGGLRVSTDAGREIRIASRKARAVLACLALRAGMPIGRDHLAALLWDESDAELARASLRQALAALRRDLPDEAATALVSDMTSVALDPATVTSDLQRFRDLVRDGSPHALAEAAERYSGELLLGFDARSAAFEAWIDEHRRALRREWSQALQRSASQCLAAADLAGATQVLARLVAVEPANEIAQRDLMEVYARQGLYTEALRQFRVCSEALRRDLDVAPEPATQALFRDILRRRRASVSGADEPAGATDDAAVDATATRSEPMPAQATPSVPPVTTLREVVVLVVRIGRSAGPADDDPEALRDRWSRAELRVREVVTRMGGVVDRPSQGEIVTAFGLAASTGNEVERALRAAAELTRSAAVAGAPRFAVGIARGLVLPAGRGEPLPIAGQPVAVAQDLARSAALDGVLVAADIAAQVADHYALGPGGAAAPAGSRCLVGEQAADGARHAADFAGRRAELAMFATLFERVAASRRGRAVIVRGEPGIGKSSLLDALASAARSRAAVHVVQVLDFGQPVIERPGPALGMQLLGVPMGVSAQARRDAIDRALRSGVLEPDDALPAADLLALEPAGAHVQLLAAMDQAAREQARARVMSKLMAHAAAHQPLLVVIEDAHWADAAEIALLGDLAGAIVTLPVLLAVSTRADGDPFSSAWRTRARGCPVTTLDLAPLADDEARELATRYGDLPDDVLERCVETAAGNPLFLVQLLRSAQAGLTALPGSVRALLLARVERLPADAQRLLHAAATLGPRFSVDALRHVAALPASDPGDIEALGLLVRDGDECRFTHALIRAAIYEALLRSTRRALHQRAALWYEGRDPALLAEHLAAAEDPTAASAHLRAAAIEQRAYRFDRAVLHAERARALAAADTDRCDASAQLGEIHLARGRTEDAIVAYRESIGLAATPGTRARARLGLATSLRIIDRYDEALEVLEHAERDAIDEGDPRRLAQVWTLRGNLHFPRGELEQCLRAHERALELAQEACSAEDIARSLGGLGDAQYQRGRMRTALAHVLRCLELSEQHGFVGLRLAHLPMAAASLSYCGEFVRALELARQAATAAQRAGDLRAELLAHSVGASAELYRADYEAALACSERSTSLARELGARRFEAEGMVIIGLAKHGLGLRAEALAILEEAAELARVAAATYCGPWALAALAIACDDVVRGRALLDEGEQLLAQRSVSHNHLEFRMLAIELLLDDGDWAAASSQAAALAAYTSEEPLPWADLVIARTQALVAVGTGTARRAAARRVRDVLHRAEQMGFEALAPRLRATLGQSH